ncbi:MAG: hypothetical protein AB7R89_09975 [Dehalococcoidia bacterium]
MTDDQPQNGGPFRLGDDVEVNIAGLRPVTVTEVLLDLESREDWYPAVVAETLPNDMYSVTVMPLIGSIEVPPVHVSRLRRR